MRRSQRQSRAWFVAFWLVMVVYLTLSVALWRRMPPRVPVHFGLGGPDRWGSRHEWLIGSLIIGLLMAGTGPGLAALLRRMPMRWSNSTSASYWKTPERWPASTAHTTAFLVAIMTLAQALPLGGAVGTWWFLDGHPFPQWLMLVALGPLIIGLIGGMVLLLRAQRPPAWWSACRRAHGHRWD